MGRGGLLCYRCLGMAVVGSREGVHFHSPPFFVCVHGLFFVCMCVGRMGVVFSPIEIFSITNLLGDHGEEAR